MSREVSREDRNARARNNQRQSRARRIEYIATLEAKVRHFESGGITATQELQLAARKIEAQNAQLRAWLSRAIGVTDRNILEWLKLSPEQAESCFAAFIVSRPFINPTNNNNHHIPSKKVKHEDALGPIGQQLVTLMTMLSTNASSEIYHNLYLHLHHILGNRLEDVITRLMTNAVLANGQDTYVDQAVVKGILHHLGIEIA